MAVQGKPIESLQLAFTTGGATEVTFRVGTVSTSIRRLIIHTTADVYLNFDGVADDTCFVLTPGCAQISIDNISFTTISALGLSGSGTVYLLALRN